MESGQGTQPHFCPLLKLLPVPETAQVWMLRWREEEMWREKASRMHSRSRSQPIKSKGPSLATLARCWRHIRAYSSASSPVLMCVERVLPYSFPVQVITPAISSLIFSSQNRELKIIFQDSDLTLFFYKCCSIPARSRKADYNAHSLGFCSSY